MKNLKVVAAAILAAFLLFGCISATEARDMPDSHQDPFIKMILGQVAFTEGRISSLAEAIPEEKFNWRPDEEVRSTSEQLVHTLAAGYFITSLMGGEKPDHITQDLEKTLTAKSDIMKNLKGSFEAVTKFLKSYDTANYEKMVKTPFGEFTQRNMILILNNHYHEHLGQLIVYARSNGIVPPWSEKPEEQ
ncbi:MAG: DinB family protein [Ignavibacteriae bacterium]|nr:DinB family protein [Ignavibacteriota bacterium]